MEQSPLFTKTTAKPMQDSKVFFLQFLFLNPQLFPYYISYTPLFPFKFRQCRNQCST